MFGADRLITEIWNRILLYYLFLVQTVIFTTNFCMYSPSIRENRVTTVQYLSGTGSLRVGGEFLAKHYHQVKCLSLTSCSPFILFNCCYYIQFSHQCTLFYCCLDFFSRLYTCHNQHGEIIQRFSHWQGYLLKHIVTMLQQHEGLTFMVSYYSIKLWSVCFLFSNLCHCSFNVTFSHLVPYRTSRRSWFCPIWPDLLFCYMHGAD